jgi:vacuolar-type H+-ATPase subunit I/STV1
MSQIELVSRIFRHLKIHFLKPFVKACHKMGFIKLRKLHDTQIADIPAVPRTEKSGKSALSRADLIEQATETLEGAYEDLDRADQIERATEALEEAYEALDKAKAFAQAALEKKQQAIARAAALRERRKNGERKEERGGK